MSFKVDSKSGDFRMVKILISIRSQFCSKALTSYSIFLTLFSTIFFVGPVCLAGPQSCQTVFNLNLFDSIRSSPMSEERYFDLIRSQTERIVDLNVVYGDIAVAQKLKELIAADAKDWSEVHDVLAEDLPKVRNLRAEALNVHGGILLMNSVGSIAAGFNVGLSLGSPTAGVIATSAFVAASIAIQATIGDLLRPAWLALTRNFILRSFSRKPPDYRNSISQAAINSSPLVLRIPGLLVAPYQNVSIEDTARSLSIAKDLLALKQDGPYVFANNYYDKLIRKGSLDVVLSNDQNGNPKLLIAVTVERDEKQVYGRFQNINEVLKIIDTFEAK